MSRFKGALLAAGLLLSFAVLAAAAPKETPPFPIHPVRLHGVIRLPNGKPAVKQQVEVRVAPREEPYRLTPGRDGRYSLTTDNAGHVIEVLAPGVGWSKALPLKPRLAKREARLDIQLYPLPVLAGRVFLPGGRPATNVMLASYGRVSRETLLPSGSYVPPNMSYLEMSGGADILGPGFSTDRQGRYRIPLGRDAQGLPYLRNGSSYDVHLFSRAGKGWVKLTDLRLDAGPAEISKDLHLQRGDRIEGVVRGYPGGVPMVGVKVEATVGIGQMHGPGVAVARAMTDRTGRFRLIQALPPKGYELIPRPSEGYGQMEMQFDPPQSEKATARRVEIGLVKDYTIRGRAYGMDGNPLADRRIMLGIASFTPGHPGILGPTQSDTAEVTTGPDGSYELPRKSGPSFYGERSTQPHWLLLAPRPSEAGVAGPATVDAADPSTHTVDLRLVAPATITGRQVESHTGKPAVGVRARLAALSPEGRRVATLYYDVDNSQPKDDATGEFTLRGVPPGPQLLELDGWTVHDRTMENGNALPITVLAGQTLDVGTVEVSYVPHFSGTFSGLPGKQQEGMVGDMEVRCALRPAGGGEWKQAFVDLWQGQGRYTVWAKDLPEGKYDAVLIASEGEQPRHVTSLVKGVELREDGKSKTVPIAFTRGASISGKMLQADGKPLAVSVTARPISGEAVALAAPALLRWMGSLHVHVKADQQGRFRITGLPPGEYEIIAHVSEGYYGPKPKQKVRVTRDQQKTGVVLRTTKAW